MKLLNGGLCASSTVVEHPTHNSKTAGLGLANGTGKEKIGDKKLFNVVLCSISTVVGALNS